jgi:DNA-binding CsgD family transcriptional regulator
MLGWGAGLAAGALLLAWANYQQLARTRAADIGLLLVAGLFLALGLWLGLGLGLGLRGRRVPPPGNPAAVASLGLTPREVEVLQLLATGQANKQIARALEVSPNTVKTHLARLFEKLGASSRTEAIARGRALGILG